MDLAAHLTRERERAVKAVELGFDRIEGIQKLNLNELSRYQADTGWTSTRRIEGKDYIFDALLPKQFPSDPMTVHVRDCNDELYLANSHVMQSGELCLFPKSTSIDVEDPVRVSLHCFDRAEALIREADTDGFSSEFESHWVRSLDDTSHLILCIDSPDALVTQCQAASVENLIIVGNSTSSIRSWLASSVGIVENNMTQVPCKVSRIGAALTPSEYPKTVPDLHKLLCKHDAHTASWLEEQLVTSKQKPLVVFLQETVEGHALAGVRTPATRLKRRKRIRRNQTIGKANVGNIFTLGGSLLNKESVERLQVRRADHQWIHTRGGDGRDLSGNSICIIGCGSLGSYVADLIARSGVSKLTLVDGETFDWNNVGRHTLGVGEVKHSKAGALAHKISRDLPHLSVYSVDCDWRSWCQNTPEELASHDLVISTTGDWRAEHSLNAMARKRAKMPTLISCWLEPFAVAGHVLTVKPVGGCLRCGISRLGAFEQSVSQFKAGTLSQEAGSCEYYQQYGPVALLPTAAMAASAAISHLESPTNHSELRTWIGPKDLFEKNYAAISHMWSSTIEQLGFNRIHIQPWRKSKVCPLCK